MRSGAYNSTSPVATHLLQAGQVSLYEKTLKLIKTFYFYTIQS